MLRKENVKSVLIASLDYESWEQFVTWKLVYAHLVKKYINIESICSVISRIQADKDNHAEALASLNDILVASACANDVGSWTGADKNSPLIFRG